MRPECCGRGRCRQKFSEWECHIERIRRIQGEQECDERSATDVIGKKEECCEQNNDDEEVARERPHRECGVRREGIHLGKTVSSRHKDSMQYAEGGRQFDLVISIFAYYLPLSAYWILKPFVFQILNRFLRFARELLWERHFKLDNKVSVVVTNRNALSSYAEHFFCSFHRRDFYFKIFSFQ